MSLDIVQNLVAQLGISEDQAMGGAGLLFKKVQEHLSTQDFSEVMGALPEVTQLINAAPSEGGGLMGMLGQVVGGKAGDLADLASGFSKLGLDANMIQQFVPILLSFVQQKGGTGVVELLQKVLKG